MQGIREEVGGRRGTSPHSFFPTRPGRTANGSFWCPPVRFNGTNEKADVRGPNGTPHVGLLVDSPHDQSRFVHHNNLLFVSNSAHLLPFQNHRVGFLTRRCAFESLIP
jgi:hypothetical protein